MEERREWIQPTSPANNPSRYHDDQDREQGHCCDDDEGITNIDLTHAYRMVTAYSMALSCALDRSTAFMEAGQPLADPLALPDAWRFSRGS